MKKKMTILGVLLLAVVVTAYSVSGTYAKYTSNSEVTDTARVAQWKLNDLASIDLFKSSYDNILDGTEASAWSLNDDKILAPGTSGQYTFNINGVFETNYEIKLELLDGSHGLQYEITGDYGNYVYDPIQFKLVKVTDVVLGDGEDVTTWTNFDGLKTALEGLSKTVYVNGTNGTIDDTYRIEWKWAFEGDGITQTDEEDTLLGNAIVDALTTIDDLQFDEAYDAAVKAKEDLSVKLNIKLTANQVK